MSRSGQRSDAEARAAAHFELGEHLHRAGDHAAAIPHWREAHRRFPHNWTYKRQAWNFEDPVRQGHTDAYDSSWYEDIKKLGFPVYCRGHHMSDMLYHRMITGVNESER